MSETKKTNPIPPQEKRENIFFDTRRLVIVDSNNLLNSKNNETELTETIMMNKAKQNYIDFASSLFDILNKQQGEEKEDLDYDKAPDELTLPESIITKWKKVLLKENEEEWFIQKKSEIGYQDGEKEV